MRKAGAFILLPQGQFYLCFLVSLSFLQLFVDELRGRTFESRLWLFILTTIPSRTKLEL